MHASVLTVRASAQMLRGKYRQDGCDQGRRLLGGDMMRQRQWMRLARKLSWRRREFGLTGDGGQHRQWSRVDLVSPVRAQRAG
jgi:hypothetical protein